MNAEKRLVSFESNFKKKSNNGVVFDRTRPRVTAVTFTSGSISLFFKQREIWISFKRQFLGNILILTVDKTCRS